MVDAIGVLVIVVGSQLGFKFLPQMHGCCLVSCLVTMKVETFDVAAMISEWWGEVCHRQSTIKRSPLFFPPPSILAELGWLGSQPFEDGEVKRVFGLRLREQSCLGTNGGGGLEMEREINPVRVLGNSCLRKVESSGLGVPWSSSGERMTSIALLECDLPAAPDEPTMVEGIGDVDMILVRFEIPVQGFGGKVGD
ncbi:hypothetical protein U1Q18_024706 [Sarracenia purpurea var. burkii]